MSIAALTLIDETDRSRRLMQHGGVLAGIVLLLLAGRLVDTPGRLAVALVLIGVALGVFVVAAVVDQRWDATHKGHRIRFQNNPFRGERLFIDDEVVAQGRLGFRSELVATIRVGEGAGERVIARTVAGLTRFHCRIVVESTDVAGGDIKAARDEDLLTEIRRRGQSAGDH